jgi:hypothetical protein
MNFDYENLITAVINSTAGIACAQTQDVANEFIIIEDRPNDKNPRDERDVPVCYGQHFEDYIFGVRAEA